MLGIWDQVEGIGLTVKVGEKSDILLTHPNIIPLDQVCYKILYLLNCLVVRTTYPIGQQHHVPCQNSVKKNCCNCTTHRFLLSVVLIVVQGNWVPKNIEIEQIVVDRFYHSCFF